MSTDSGLRQCRRSDRACRWQQRFRVCRRSRWAFILSALHKEAVKDRAQAQHKQKNSKARGQRPDPGAQRSRRRTTEQHPRAAGGQNGKQKSGCANVPAARRSADPAVSWDRGHIDADAGDRAEASTGREDPSNRTASPKKGGSAVSPVTMRNAMRYFGRSSHSPSRQVIAWSSTLIPAKPQKF